ncbi:MULTISPECIES: hypothetical protein [Aeromonas]|uniref:hypothetical protein n=1 Tax=Aeromonas TaxID=642 RepID=UPI00224D9DE5|nr:hypothetical protein [Aeromonas veronii]MCX4045666.1 hypothetical protein [Aeromonas veronii]
MSDLKGEVVLDVDGEEQIIKGSEFGWEDGGQGGSSRIYIAFVDMEDGAHLHLKVYVDGNDISEASIQMYDGDQDIEVVATDLK